MSEQHASTPQRADGQGPRVEQPAPIPFGPSISLSSQAQSAELLGASAPTMPIQRDAELGEITPPPTTPFAGTYAGGLAWGDEIHLMQAASRVWGFYRFNAGVEIDGRITDGAVTGERATARYGEEKGGSPGDRGRLVLEPMDGGLRVEQQSDRSSRVNQYTWRTDGAGGPDLPKLPEDAEDAEAATDGDGGASPIEPARRRMWYECWVRDAGTSKASSVAATADGRFVGRYTEANKEAGWTEAGTSWQAMRFNTTLQLWEVDLPVPQGAFNLVLYQGGWLGQYDTHALAQGAATAGGNAWTQSLDGIGQGPDQALGGGDGASEGSAEQQIFRMCTQAPVADRVPMLRLVEALMAVDPSFVMQRYERLAQVEDQDLAAARSARLFEALRADGMWHHEAAVLGWWAGEAGVAGARAALVEAVAAAPATARARLRVFLAGETPVEDARAVVSAIALRAAQGEPGGEAPATQAEDATLGTNTQLLLAAVAPDAGAVSDLASAVQVLDYWDVGLRGFLETYLRLQASERDAHTLEIDRIEARLASTGDFALSLVEGLFVGSDVTDRALDAKKLDTLKLWKQNAEARLAGGGPVNELFPVWIEGVASARQTADEGREALTALADTRTEEGDADPAAAGTHATTAAEKFAEVKAFIEGNREQFGDRLGQVHGFLERIAERDANAAALKAKAEQGTWVSLLQTAGGAFAGFNARLVEAAGKVDWLAVLEVAAEIAGTIATGGAALVAKVLFWLGKLAVHGKPLFDGFSALGGVFQSVVGGAFAGLRSLFTVEGFVDTAAGLFFGETVLSQLPAAPETRDSEEKTREGSLGTPGKGLAKFMGLIVAGVQKLFGAYTGATRWLGEQADKVNLTAYPWFHTIAGVVKTAFESAKAVFAPEEVTAELKGKVGGFLDGITSRFTGLLAPVKEVLATIASPGELFKLLIRGGLSWILGLLILKPPSAVLGAAMKVFQGAVLGGQDIAEKILSWQIAGQPVGQLIVEKIEAVLVGFPLFAELQQLAGLVGELLAEVTTRFEATVQPLKDQVMGLMSDGTTLMTQFFGIQRDAAAAGAAPVTRGAVDAMQRSAGAPLAGPVKAQMEAGFGRDFSNVRVHTDGHADGAARGLKANAMTQGSDIYFRAGRFDPGSTAGKTLLAHELSHVVQQGQAPTMGQQAGAPSSAPQSAPQLKAETSNPNDFEEIQAERVADRLVAGVPGAAAELGAGASPSVVRRAVAAKDFGAKFKKGTVQFGAAVHDWKVLIDQTAEDTHGKRACKAFAGSFVASGKHREAFLRPFMDEPQLIARAFSSIVDGFIGRHALRDAGSTDVENLKVVQRWMAQCQAIKVKAPDTSRDDLEVVLDRKDWLSTLYCYAAASLMIWLDQRSTAAEVQDALTQGDFWSAMKLIEQHVADCGQDVQLGVFGTAKPVKFSLDDAGRVVLNANKRETLGWRFVEEHLPTVTDAQTLILHSDVESGDRFSVAEAIRTSWHVADHNAKANKTDDKLVEYAKGARGPFAAIVFDITGKGAKATADLYNAVRPGAGGWVKVDADPAKVRKGFTQYQEWLAATGWKGRRVAIGLDNVTAYLSANSVAFDAAQAANRSEDNDAVLERWLTERRKLKGWPAGQWALLFGKTIKDKAQRKSHHDTPKALVEVAMQAAKAANRTLVPIGDPVESFPDVPNLVKFWSDESFPLKAQGLAGQLALYRYMARTADVINLGMRSGVLNATAYQGIPTFQIEEQGAERGVNKFQKIMKACPNAFRIQIEHPVHEDKDRLAIAKDDFTEDEKTLIHQIFKLQSKLVKGIRKKQIEVYMQSKVFKSSPEKQKFAVSAEHWKKDMADGLRAEVRQASTELNKVVPDITPALLDRLTIYGNNELKWIRKDG